MKASETMQLADLHDLADSALLGEVYERLYLPSVLAPEERQALATFERRLGSAPPGPPEPLTSMIVAGENLADPLRRKLAGYLILEFYRESRTALLAYVGTASEFRRQGLMRRMYALAVERLRREQGDVRAAFTEIHVPGRIAAQREPMETLARVCAFARIGARLVPIPYVQPALEEGQPFGTDLMLLSLPTQGEPDATTELPLPASAVADFLDEYYRSCGLDDPAGCPGYAEMLSARVPGNSFSPPVAAIVAACDGTLPVATLR